MKERRSGWSPALAWAIQESSCCSPQALCDLIPMIGATLGAVAALLTTGLWPTTVIVALFFVGYQQLENYVIAPRILRHTVSLSAAAVLAGLIGGTVLGL